MDVKQSQEKCCRYLTDQAETRYILDKNIDQVSFHTLLASIDHIQHSYV